jgi:hypothetical protein
MQDREKEIKHLIYLKSELIKQTKKEIKQLQQERDSLQGMKRIRRQYETNNNRTGKKS